MMRARHQRSLVKSSLGWRPESWLPRLRRCCQRPRELECPIPAETSKSTVSDIELQELGRDEIKFVWAVERLVKIDEEGLFRHAVAYL